MVDAARRNTRRPGAAALVGMLGLVACGAGGDGSGAQPAVADASATSTGSVPSAASSVAPITAERIVPVNGDLAEVVYALGLGEQVVATDISATYPPEADETPKIGYQRTLVAETILSFEPTVVLADDLAGPAEVLDQLRDAGVRVVQIEEQTSLDAPAAKIRAVAEALGVPDRGEELVSELEADLVAAEAQVAEVDQDGRPRVLALYLRGSAVQQVFGDGSGIDAVIEAAGGTDLGTEMGVVDNAQLSIESIIAAQPEVLLVTTSGLESVGGVDGLLSIPGIDRTPAARDRRVVAFEDQDLYGLGPRTGQLVGELAGAIHE
ncbi:MAG: heme/hemin ABC transporter substrate-binding protein [Ilumatobacteraceae bacterium]